MKNMSKTTKSSLITYGLVVLAYDYFLSGL